MRLVLSRYYFRFQNKAYQPEKGVSVRSPISSTIAEIFLQHFEDIQGDSGGICTTLGNDSMSDLSKKVHTNIGPILNGYGVMTA
jgi:hypothetical protein